MRAALLLLLLTGCGGCGPQAPEVAAVRDLGPLPMPALATARDGAVSGRAGGQVLWTFGDTLLRAEASDGHHFRSSTAALAPLADPLRFAEPLDDAGAPAEFLPFSAGEEAYNLDGGPQERFAHWPGAVVELGGRVRVAYADLKVHPGFLNYELVGVGWATVEGTVATLDPGLVFHAPEPSYDLAGLVDQGFLYLCATTPVGAEQRVTLARAPVGREAERAAFAFWDGSAWSPDWSRAATIFTGAPGDLSLSWNDHLGRFIAVYSEPFGDRVFLRAAPRPEGPWGEPVTLFTGQKAGEGNDYAGKAHPELEREGGRTLRVTYARPLGGFDGEVRLVEVDLR